MLLSIVTPSLNSSPTIGECVRSVTGQGLAVEHLLVDGGSTDGTLERIAELNPGARVIHEPPRGIYPAINAGIRAASGEIIGVLHADDFYPADDVLQQVGEVFENPAVDACYGDLCYVDRANPDRLIRYWRAGDYAPERFRHGWMPPHPTFFVRSRVYETYGLYREDLGTAADYEMMLRLLVRLGVRAAYLPRVLVHMRGGGASNRSLVARLRANRMDRRAWQVNGLKPYPWTTLAKPLRKVGQWLARPQ